MKITFHPLLQGFPSFGPYTGVTHVRVVNRPSMAVPGEVAGVPDHHIYFANGNYTGLVLPTDQTYSILIEEEGAPQA